MNLSLDGGFKGERFGFKNIFMYYLLLRQGLTLQPNWALSTDLKLTRILPPSLLELWA